MKMPPFSSPWLRRAARSLTAAFHDESRQRRTQHAYVPVAAEVQVLEERALLSAVYSVASAMNWGTTAPSYPTDVSYTSGGQWQSLKVVNYSPSHYADFNSNGQLTFSDGAVLGDTTFQTNLPTDSPFLSANTPYGTFVNYRGTRNC